MALPARGLLACERWRELRQHRSGRVRPFLNVISNCAVSPIVEAIAELIRFEGVVTEILPDTRYRVKVDTGYEITALGDSYAEESIRSPLVEPLGGLR